ncbi:unnamed protein product, partial [Staurois parvus]
PPSRFWAYRLSLWAPQQVLGVQTLLVGPPAGSGRTDSPCGPPSRFWAYRLSSWGPPSRFWAYRLSLWGPQQVLGVQTLLVGPPAGSGRTDSPCGPPS